ncbi:MULTISPECIES: SAM-dependent methyltransferase [Streptomyces]|uniref:SAM-dependent methyltransferase n=1 Tax=Streptomyces TaxID=1883 RepID=UPI0033C0AF20
MPDAPRPDTAPTRALIRSKGEPEAPYDGGPPAHDNIRKPWPGRVYDVLTAGGCRHSYQSDRAWGQALVKALAVGHELHADRRADARDVPAMLAADRLFKLFDLTEPIGVILHDVLPWLGDDEAAQAMRDLHELLPAGSAISLTHATGDENPAGMDQLVQAYTEAGFDYRPRALDQITELVGPWDLLDPGLQPTSQWRRDQPPHIPKQFLPDLHLPQNGSHAYAAVTAPKTAAPPTFT